MSEPFLETDTFWQRYQKMQDRVAELEGALADLALCEEENEALLGQRKADCARIAELEEALRWAMNAVDIYADEAGEGMDDLSEDYVNARAALAKVEP